MKQRERTERVMRAEIKQRVAKSKTEPRNVGKYMDEDDDDCRRRL